MRQFLRLLPILAVLGLGACAASIPESNWKPSSIDEMMGGDQVASFDTTYIRPRDGRKIPLTADIDFNKKELVFKDQRSNSSNEVYYWKAWKNGSGFCVQYPPSDPRFDAKKKFCYTVEKAAIKKGETLFRTLTRDGTVLHTEIRRRNN